MKGHGALSFGWALALLLGLPFSSVQAADMVVYYHTDALHSVSVVTNEQGQVIERTRYAPYGAVLGRPMRDGPGYTGHQEDAATGLVYMQQRYYDPQAGRFLSVDPVLPTANGGNFNRYWYANDNPYRYTDPDGRQTAADYQNLRQQQQSIPDVPLSLTPDGSGHWQVVPTAVAGDVMLARASGTSLGQYTAPPTRQGTARVMDKVALGGTAISVVTVADAPPVAIAAGGVSEVASVGAFLLDPTTGRLVNVFTIGGLRFLKAAATGSTVAEQEVTALDAAGKAATLSNAVGPAGSNQSSNSTGGNASGSSGRSDAPSSGSHPAPWRIRNPWLHHHDE